MIKTIHADAFKKFPLVWTIFLKHNMCIDEDFFEEADVSSMIPKKCKPEKKISETKSKKKDDDEE